MSPIAFNPEAAALQLARNQAADATAPTSPSKSSEKGAKALDPKLAKAAQEFEAVFIRQLLKPLEKAGETGKGNAVSSGSGVYGSMMVGAVADQASAGGGIGLAEMVLKALTDAGKAAPKDVSPAVPGEAVKLSKIKGL